MGLPGVGPAVAPASFRRSKSERGLTRLRGPAERRRLRPDLHPPRPQARPRAGRTGPGAGPGREPLRWPEARGITRARPAPSAGGWHARRPGGRCWRRPRTARRARGSAVRSVRGTACSSSCDEALVDPPSLTGKDDLAPLAAIDHFDRGASGNSREHRLAIARPGTHIHVGDDASDTDRERRSLGPLD